MHEIYMSHGDTYTGFEDNTVHVGSIESPSLHLLTI